MLYHHFRANAQRWNDRAAIVCGERSASYGHLLSASERIGARLRAAGIARGDAVVVLLPNGIDFACAVLGILGIEAICVPLNTRFAAAEIRVYVENAQAKALIHEREFAGMLDALAPHCACFALFDGELEPTRAGTAESASAAAHAGDPAATYMYSSGSTGKPKRVMRTQGQWYAEYRALAATVALSDSERFLCTIPLFHTHGFGNCLMAPLMSGSTLVIVPGEFNARTTVAALESHRTTVFPAVPFMFKMISDTPFRKRPDLSTVRLSFSAGAALPEEVARWFREHHGRPVRQLYGSTETGAVTINHDGPPGSESSVGRPLQGVEIDLLDEAGRAVAPDAIGEVAIRSPGMTRQYDGMPELTAECFVGGYFLLGDLGSKDHDGRIYIRGRKKLLINVAGHKVDPLDVESMIRTLPWVSDVVVLGQSHAIYGEQVKAVIVPRDAVAREPQQVVDYCARHLAEYKVPRVVEFRREIPKSPLGKILRKYL